MGTTTVNLGRDADLIIEEPSALTSRERGLIVTEAIVQEFSETTLASPTIRYGTVPVTIGYSIYHVKYKLQIRRIMNSLEAYSQAIAHIQSNPSLYDRRLAEKAIQVLRKCHNDKLR